MKVEIRGEDGQVRSDHQIGKVWCHGTSVMHSYFRNPEATAECLVDGWLDTGDMGYMAGGNLLVVGRAKDMIIIKGTTQRSEESGVWKEITGQCSYRG